MAKNLLCLKLYSVYIFLSLYSLAETGIKKKKQFVLASLIKLFMVLIVSMEYTGTVPRLLTLFISKNKQIK